MTNEQLKTLLSLYKKALSNNLTVGDFEEEIKDTRLDLDKFYVQKGKEDMNLGEYLNELLELQNALYNE